MTNDCVSIYLEKKSFYNIMKYIHIPQWKYFKREIIILDLTLNYD